MSQFDGLDRDATDPLEPPLGDGSAARSSHLSNEASQRRSELLEWIIILLIFTEIAMSIVMSMLRARGS